MNRRTWAPLLAFGASFSVYGTPLAWSLVHGEGWRIGFGYLVLHIIPGVVVGLAALYQFLRPSRWATGLIVGGGLVVFLGPLAAAQLGLPGHLVPVALVAYHWLPGSAILLAGVAMWNRGGA